MIGGLPIRRIAPILALLGLAATLTFAGRGLAATPASATAAGAETGAVRACSSYPTPGSLAPAGARPPAWLVRRYAILGRPQRPQDRLRAGQVSASLTAAGLELDHAHLLGAAAFGGRIYLVPAEHLLAFRLAPDRCLPRGERALEHELAPQLRAQYRHPALCVVVLHSSSASPTCGAAGADPGALLYAAGTPGFGLVANGIDDVTVSYLTAPARTVRVRDNVFILDEPRESAAPCALQWEDATGNVAHTFAGCDYAQLLRLPLDRYRSEVAATLSTLTGQLDTLAQAIAAGDLAGAESDWLTAHLTWQSIGQDDGAYSAYGALGRELDGTAAGLPGGSADPHFTGFHRVEQDLWSDGDLSAAARDTSTLQAILGQIVATPLAEALPATNLGIANWVLRPHETLEDALRDTLSGDDDYGSGTGVASITADVTATRQLLDLMGGVLAPLAPGLIPHAESELTALDAACAASRVDGRWVAVAALPVRQREQIDADAGAAAQTLARVPAVLTNVGIGAPT